MNVMQISHPTLPFIVGFNLNKQVGLIPQKQFKTIVDDSGGLLSVFDNEGYSINGLEYEYGQWYDCEGSLQVWLVAQHLGISVKGFWN